MFIPDCLECARKCCIFNNEVNVAFWKHDSITIPIHLVTLANDNLLAFIGFICVDNTLLQGQVYLRSEERAKNGEAIACCNRIVKDDSQSRVSV
ncbi:MAG: hypothetical protein V7K40_08705 [Nostoc sp.]|uniref:hypothetical protein n=1 Tax=Nostoc sp. TaxID=1180 RepID=UPI002FFCB2AE